MKFTSTLKQNKMLKLSVLLSLTAIAGFAYSSSTLAEEFITQPEDGPFYLDGDEIKNTAEGCYTKKFTIPYSTSIKIDLVDPFLRSIIKDFNDINWIYKVDLPNLPQPKNGGPNAVSLKYWDGEKYSYKVMLSLPIEKDDTAGVWHFSQDEIKFITMNLFDNANVQNEIYNALREGNEDVVQNIMTKLLPEVALVHLEPQKLEELKDFGYGKYTNEILDIDQSLFDNGALLECKYTFISEEGFPADKTSKHGYAYQKITLNDYDIWKPMDRAISITSPEGEYKLPKYWVTGTGSGKAELADNVTSPLKPSTSGSVVDNSISVTEPKPVDERTTIPVKEMITGIGSIIDLAYPATLGDSPAVINGGFKTGLKDEQGRDIMAPVGRYLHIDKATLGQDTTFRIIGSFDTIRIIDAEQAEAQIAANEKTNLNIQFAYINDIGTKPFYKEKLDNPSRILEILYGNENFEVTAQKSRADGIFASYEITPEIIREDNTIKTEKSQLKYKQDENGNYLGRITLPGGKYGEAIIMNKEGTAPFKPADPSFLTDEEMNYIQLNGAIHEHDEYGHTAFTHTVGSTWLLSGYSYEDTGEVAERGRTVSENSSIMRNLLRINNKNLFRRAEQLRPSNLARITKGGQGSTLDANDLRGEARENLWADVWHGKFSPEAGYGRTAEQSYNGVQVGYDKLLDKKFYNGKVYTGVYGSMMDGDSTTQTGEGEQKAYGVGVYSTWIGDRGHFLDLGMNATKLKNEYWLTANTGEGEIGKIDASNSTWAYGIGAQYGMRNQLTNNWFWEPSISFYAGHVGGSDYYIPGMIEVTQDMQDAGYQLNNMKINESSYNSAIGRLGLKTGYNVKDEANFYAGVSYAHDFADGPRLEQSLATRYGPTNIVGSDRSGIVFDNKGRKIDSYDGNDSWWEWSLGANAKISDNGIFNIDYLKTTGSDIGDDWSINGGLSFTWDGWANTVRNKDGKTNFTAAHSPTVVLGQKPSYKNVNLPQLQAKEGRKLDATNQQEVTTDTEVTGEFVEGTGDFYMGGVTVEAERPDWEKALSPGQVSVIYPSQFEGEQKNLPEMLDRIPGLYVQKLNGYGHYTVARMRGSSAAQVAVYVDGVLMNLTGDAAVNLNAIPADNIERIEVYRGYVPARFAGAPMGGVINILTKRPNEGHGHISQGYKDYGGYNATYEYSMPLGDGSLLATYSRDIWQGDFDWLYPQKQKEDITFKRRSNDYQNNNALLKWQNDHWTVKVAWKKSQEGLAIATNGLNLVDYGYRDNIQTIDHKEFQIGRRDTLGNLDLGWHIAYLDNDKHFTNTGALKLVEDSKAGTTPPGVAPQTESFFCPGQLWGTYHSKKWNGNVNSAMKMGSSHLLEFNGDVTYENMDCNGNAWNTKTQTNWVVENAQTGEGRFVRAMLPEYKNKEFHLTLQDTITLNQAGDFKLTGIGRADKVDMEGIGPSGNGRDSWKYSGGVAFQKQLDDNLSIKSTWGTYNRHPNFYEIFGDGGFIRSNYVYKDADGKPMNPDMWENGTQFDISLNWQGNLAHADTDTVLTYYSRRSENQLVLWTPRGGDGISTYAPTGDMKAYGVELSHNMKWDRLNFGLAATWQKSKALDGGLGWQYNWEDGKASFVPEWVLSARVDYLFPGDKLNVFGEYRYTDNEVLWGEESDEGIQTRRSYSIIDLGAKYTFDKQWRLNVGVNDLLDKGKEVFIDNKAGGRGPALMPNLYPLPGRMYYTTLEYSF